MGHPPSDGLDEAGEPHQDQESEEEDHPAGEEMEEALGKLRVPGAQDPDPRDPEHVGEDRHGDGGEREQDPRDPAGSGKPCHQHRDGQKGDHGLDPAAGLHHPQRDVGKVDDVAFAKDRDPDSGEDRRCPLRGDPLERNRQGVEEDVGELDHEEKVQDREAEPPEGLPPPVPRHEPRDQEEDRELLHVEEAGEASRHEKEDPRRHQDEPPGGGNVVRSGQSVPVEIDQEDEDERDEDPVGIGRKG